MILVSSNTTSMEAAKLAMDCHTTAAATATLATATFATATFATATLATATLCVFALATATFHQIN